MIDKATVRRIIDTADIVEVVGGYVHLTKRGSNYMGLCPFHNEKTPSFSVNRQRNICKCFSCGKGGSPVNFIMEKEGVNYHDALVHLAKKYGIKIEEREQTDEERQQQSQREGMLVVNEWAMQRMEHNLTETDEGRNVGLQYLYQRGITAEAIKKFRLGYAIDKGQDLYDQAVKEGYDVQTLKDVGLCGESQQGRYYDRFRGRVIFPVLNPAGKVIAFGGRGIKGEAAKYINSPESLIYRKSNELYGIYQAKNSIVRQDKCFLVEGYMDVIGMWQAGMENVVASSGTSLTDGQIALIHRFTENVTLIYDGDSAGIKASLRGIDLLLSHNLNIKVLLLPEGEDPDSFSQKHTPEEFRQYVEQNETDFIIFKTNVLLKGSGNDPVKRSQAVRSIVKSLASISDMIKRSVYIQECSRLLNIPENVLIMQVKQARGEVVEEMRKKREYERIEADNTQVSVEDEIVEAIKTKPDTTTPQVHEDKFAHILRPLERNVIKYCVRYGMLDYGDEVDTDGNMRDIKVYDVVRNEMEADDMLELRTPIYQRIFDRILDMVPEYQQRRNEYMDSINDDLQEVFNQGLDKIASRQLTMDEIIREEEALKAEIMEMRRQKEVQFDKLYIGRLLSNDPDDELRHEVIEMINEKYTLSKYHTKNTKVEDESERLMDLVPRALDEWKDGVLLVKLKEAQSQLKDAVASSDHEQTMAIMEYMQRITEWRREFAKQIGERIILPKR